MSGVANDALIQALMEITQCSEHRAQALLEAAGGNIDTAAMLHFDNGLGDAQSQSAQPAQPSRSSRSSQRNRSNPRGDSNTRVPLSLMEELNQDLVTETAPRVPPQPRTWELAPTSVLMLALLPIKIVRGAIDWIMWLLGLSTPRNDANIVFDQKRVAAQYKLWLQNNYGSSGSFLFDGGYLDALTASSSQLKYLIVILTSEVHEDTPRFMEKVLLGERFQTQLVNRSDVIFWAGSVQQSESYLLSQELMMRELPLVSLIAPSPKTPQSSTVVMAALHRLEGAKYIDDGGIKLIRELEEHIEDHAPKLMALQLERQRAEADRSLREEQDSAYQRSLEADRQREQQRLAQLAEQEEQRNRQIINEQKLKLYRRQLAARFATEPVKAENATRVLIRLPDGQRLVRWFKDQESITNIYDFVWLRLNDGDSDDGQEGASGANNIDISDYIPNYGFELMSPILRRAVPVSSALIGDEPAVWPNGSLVVDITDDSD